MIANSTELQEKAVFTLHGWAKNPQKSKLFIALLRDNSGRFTDVAQAAIREITHSKDSSAPFFDIAVRLVMNDASEATARKVLELDVMPSFSHADAAAASTMRGYHIRG